MSELKNMTIGEMAKQCKTTVKTLRYYEKIGLLKPFSVDKANGYRHYTPEQLGIMGVISYLKGNEFTIPEIKMILQEKNSDLIEKMFVHKKKKLEEQIHRLLLKKDNVEKRITFFNQAKELNNKCFENNGFSVKIMEISKRIVAGSRKKDVLTPAAIMQLGFNFAEWKKKYQIDFKEHFFIFHGGKYTSPSDIIDYEVCWIMASENCSHLPFVRTIPAGLYAVSGFQGKVSDSLAFVKTLYQWLKDNSYEAAGPLEVYYLKYYLHTLDPHNFSATYQIPVRKI